MNTKTRKLITISISVFPGLAAVFAVLVIATSGLPDSCARTILGSAVLEMGLTFCLLRLTGSKY